MASLWCSLRVLFAPRIACLREQNVQWVLSRQSIACASFAKHRFSFQDTFHYFDSRATSRHVEERGRVRQLQFKPDHSGGTVQ